MTNSNARASFALADRDAALHAMPDGHRPGGGQAQNGSHAPRQHSTQHRRITIVHPSRLFRECLQQALTAKGVVESVTHFAEIAEATADLETPGVGLLLVKQPTGASAEAALRRLLELVDKRVPIVLTGSCDDAQVVVGFLSEGVSGYIPTSLDLSVTIQALCLVLAGGTYAPPEYLLRLSQVKGGGTEKRVEEGFTAKQLAVIEAIRHGKPNKTIAYELNMCEGTVKVHIRHIMKKLQARNRTQVAFFATQMAQEARGDESI